MAQRNVISSWLLLTLLGAMGTSASVHAQEWAWTDTYMRIETGLSRSRVANIKDRVPGTPPMICGDPACAGPGIISSAGSTVPIGLGIGFRFWYLRGELVYLHRSFAFDSDDEFSPPNHFSATVRSHSVVLNAYLDLGSAAPGTWSPYIGGGGGAAYNEFSKVGILKSGISGTAPGGNRYGKTWAAMMGFSYGMPGGTKFDIGYRYTTITWFQTDSGFIRDAGGNVIGAFSGFDGRLKAHELVLGVRF